MLGKRRSFRPVLGEALEDRTVPSPFGLGRFFSGFGGFFGRATATVPAQDAQQVSREFATFQRAYSQDVRSVLLPAGTTNPSTNRPAFDAAVATALGALNMQIDATIANLPGSASLAATIQGELLGGGTNTLQTLLGAIPTPGDLSFRSVRTVTGEASVYINQIASNVTNQVRTSQAPTGSISQATIQQDLGQVQSAFRAFSQTYNGDVQTILLPAGTTNPSTNRPAFDAAVGTALGTLNTSIDAALGNLPSALTATLDTTVRNDLVGGASSPSGNLQARLAALPSPTGPEGFATFAFRFGSSLTIGGAQGQVNRDIQIAISQYNASLSGSTSSG